MAGKRRIKSRIRIGDTVEVISGAHRGATGTVTRFNPDKNRVYVEGVNLVKRHEKPRPQLGRNGGIIEKEASIHTSNVAVVDGDGNKTKVGYKVLDNGQKVRVSRATGKEL